MKSNKTIAEEKAAKISELNPDKMKGENSQTISFSDLKGLESIGPLNANLKSNITQISKSVKKAASDFAQIAAILEKTDEEVGATFDAK